MSAAGDGHWDDAVHFLSYGEDFLDGSNLGNHFQIVIFLAADRAVDVHGEAKFFIQQAYDCSGWATTPGVKEVFWENTSEIFHGFGPSAVMERHGVGNSAVAVKDVSAESLVRNFEFQKILSIRFCVLPIDMVSPGGVEPPSEL